MNSGTTPDNLIPLAAHSTETENYDTQDIDTEVPPPSTTCEMFEGGLGI